MTPNTGGVTPHTARWAMILGVCVVIAGNGGTVAAAAPLPDALTESASGVSWSPPGAVWGPRTPLPAVRASLPSRGAAFAAAVVRVALRYLGRPYQWSGIGHRGFDCSGLVSRVFGVLGIVLPHSTFALYHAGAAVASASLGPGDLVFFRTYSAGPSHVGIYLGVRRFIHASASRGVIVSSMDEPYYRNRFMGARRP